MSLALAAFLLAGPGEVRGRSLAVDTFNITMKDNAFDPPTVTIPSGTTVRWLNAGSRSHTTSSTDPASNASDGWTSGASPLIPSASYSRHFTTVRSYSYKCDIHTGMTGTIVVTFATATPAATTTATVTATPTPTATATIAPKGTATPTASPTATPTPESTATPAPPVSPTPDESAPISPAAESGLTATPSPPPSPSPSPIVAPPVTSTPTPPPAAAPAPAARVEAAPPAPAAPRVAAEVRTMVPRADDLADRLPGLLPAAGLLLATVAVLYYLRP
ncbi:MAG: cupredoxin domain-containing protein [Chloroflexi bacterium]|nr:cupredoxin domain-containing protein [Chloroflexota bacterium]